VKAKTHINPLIRLACEGVKPKVPNIFLTCTRAYAHTHTEKMFTLFAFTPSPANIFNKLYAILPFTLPSPLARDRRLVEIKSVYLRVIDLVVRLIDISDADAAQPVAGPCVLTESRRLMRAKTLYKAIDGGNFVFLKPRPECPLFE
jgi:hypothetical protein